MFFGDGTGASYMYDAVVDKDMMFMEMMSGFTGQVIKPEDDMFKIVME